MHLDKAMKRNMFTANNVLRKLSKPLLMTYFFCQSCLSFAQNPPTTEEASAPSAAAPIAAEKPIYSSNSERDNDLLAKAFTSIAKADELLWLETPDEKVLSLYKPGETRKTLGLLLIMHAPEVPQLWPSNLENLRRNLPLYSWSTIALPLPAKYSTETPQRDSPAVVEPATDASSSAAPEAAPVSSAASSESAKPILPRDKIIAGRVTAAVGEINKLGKLDLAVLVDNSSAPDALASLYPQFNITKENTTESALKALILVNLQDQEPLTKTQLAAIFANSNLRVMDVFFNPDNKAQAEVRRLHKAEAMRQNIKDYRQLIIPAQPSVSVEDTQNFWLGKTHGFLNSKLEKDERSKERKSSESTNPK